MGAGEEQPGVAEGSSPGAAAAAAVAEPVEGLWVQGRVSISLARAASGGLGLGWPQAEWERTRVLGQRAQRLSAGAPLLLVALLLVVAPLPSAAHALPSRGNAQDNRRRPELPGQ